MLTTFACGFDDLREDILGDVNAALHGSLSVLNPPSSSVPQQTTSLLHLINERPVLWLELGMKSYRILHSFQYVSSHILQTNLQRSLTAKKASLTLYTIPFRHISTALGKGELSFSRSKSTPNAT